MKKLTGFLLMSAFLLAACQKEIDWGTGGAALTDQLLVKIISKTGTDSTIVTYTYNTAKQLTWETTTGISGTNSVDSDLKIFRNSSGIIERTVQVASELTANGIDSIVTRFNYSAALSRYSSAVFPLTFMGTSVVDSVVFKYDGAGKITSDEHYLKASILPLPVLSFRNQYTYSADGTNLTGAQQFASTAPGGPLSSQAAQTYTFDTKKNPLIIKQEAILFFRTGLFNANNPVKTIVTNTSDPTADFTLDVMYRYNLAGKPDSSYSTRTPGGEITASKYFYQ